MTNIKTVKRVAKIGEKILITNPEYTMGRYEKGDTLKVKSYNDDRSVYAEGVDICILHEEYEVIIEEYDYAPKSLATRKQAEELLAELRRQAYAEGYEQAKKDAEKELLYKPTESIAP